MSTGDQWTHDADEYAGGAASLIAFADSLDERATKASTLSTDIPTNAASYKSSYDSGGNHTSACTAQSAKAAEFAARLKHASRLARFYSSYITKQSAAQDDKVDESVTDAETRINPDVDPTKTKPKTTTVSDNQPAKPAPSGDDRTEI
ncbi:MAG: hypothetical protein KDB26_13870 [Microthrixaceae bacterium]|nr:hypothetical protein [Microthrixaceae bacterium]